MADFAEYQVKDVAKQDKKWVEKCLRMKRNLALVKHMMALHDTPSGEPFPQECRCGFSAQGIIDLMGWDDVKGEGDYRYQTGAREYPRLMALRPELDHRKYTACVLRTKTMEHCLLHFALHHGRMPESMILEALEKRIDKELKREANFATAASHEIWERHMMEGLRISPRARKSALKRCGDAREQVEAFLRAHCSATLVMEVHGQ